MSAFRWCWRWPKRACASTSTTSISASLDTLEAGKPALHRTRRRKRAGQGAGRQAAGVHRRARPHLDRRAGDRHHRHADRRIPQSGAPRGAGLHRRHAAARWPTGNWWCCARPCSPAPPTGWRPISKRKGRKLKVAFCPERVVQGYGLKELREMPQIVSRQHAGSRARGGRAVRAHRAGSGGGHADRGGIRQAVRQRLSLYRVRRHQRVLPDRQVGRRRLSARAGGDEAQLSAR